MTDASDPVRARRSFLHRVTKFNVGEDESLAARHSPSSPPVFTFTHPLLPYQNHLTMAPKSAVAEKKPASTASKAPAKKPAGKAPAKKAVKKTPAADGEKKKKRKTRKET